MPAFYRMPVFYLVGATALTVVGLRHWRPGEQRSRATQSRAPVAPAIQPAAPTQASQSPDPDPADAILRTPEGLRRKIVVKDLDLVGRSEPAGGVAVGKPFDYFSIHYLYGETHAEPRMLQVGTRDGKAMGWVPATSVLEWDTRLMARPTADPSRPPLVVYRERSCLLDRLAGRECPRHGQECPTEGEEADRSAAGSAPAAGLPILAAQSIPQATGPVRTIFEVASLVRDLAPVPEPAVPPVDLQPALKQVFIAFVIDTTRSMQASIEAVRATATALVDAAGRRYADVTLHLAVVEYRDADPAYGFRSHVASDFTGPARFHKAIAALRVSKHADGSVDEAVLDGVASALPRRPGEPPGDAEHLDWPTGRVGQLSSKLLILLGDAPDHARDLVRARSLAELARNEGITIAAVQLAGMRSPGDEEPRYRAQWKTLAEESFRPRDRAAGFARPIAPLLLSLGAAQGLADELQALIADRVEAARHLAALAAAEAERRLDEYVNSQGLTLAQVHPVLVDLHRGDAARSPRPDPRFHGRKAPSVRKGWIAEAQGGHRLVDVEVLMSRAELDDLIRELTALEQAAQGSARDLAGLLQIGTAAASGETAFLARDRGGQTFADHLRRRQGLPPMRPESLLRRTQADLLQADDLYRGALDARLSQAIARLVHRRNEPDWDEPARTLDRMALVPYDWIDF
jgi:hypothetical protein